MTVRELSKILSEYQDQDAEVMINYPDGTEQGSYGHVERFYKDTGDFTLETW